jgi:hypothetical protein
MFSSGCREHALQIFHRFHVTACAHVLTEGLHSVDVEKFITFLILVCAEPSPNIPREGRDSDSSHKTQGPTRTGCFVDLTRQTEWSIHCDGVALGRQPHTVGSFPEFAMIAAQGRPFLFLIE